MISVGLKELIAAYFEIVLKKLVKNGRELLYNLRRKHPHDEVACDL